MRTRTLSPGGGVTTHHNVGVIVLIKIGIECRLADRAPTLLLFEQVDAIESPSLPHQTPAIFPIARPIPQVRDGSSPRSSGSARRSCPTGGVA
jgi:hypothetical protein